MVNILLSGNFSILNHLTIVPALACMDDVCFPRWIKAYVYRIRRIELLGLREVPFSSKIKRSSVDLCLLALIGVLSVPVVLNLLQVGGNHQIMNASFGSFKLVNTYGAFGSVGEARYEPIISVSNDGRDWDELQLPCKPGDVKRRPCFCAPYHYRLDWNIWFIGFKPHQSMLQRRESWMFELIQKMLVDGASDDRPWLTLLDPGSAELLRNGPVKYAKVDMYRYSMANPIWTIAGMWLRGEEVEWWTRKFEEILIPPVFVQDGKLALAPMSGR